MYSSIFLQVVRLLSICAALQGIRLWKKVSERFDCDVLTKLNQDMRYLPARLPACLSVCLSVSASTKSRVTIGPPAKRHSDSVSLAGESGPILRAYWGFAIYPSLSTGKIACEHNAREFELGILKKKAQKKKSFGCVLTKWGVP